MASIKKISTIHTYYNGALDLLHIQLCCILVSENYKRALYFFYVEDTVISDDSYITSVILGPNLLIYSNCKLYTVISMLK
ncbi:hypothetical protein V1477_012898 [Vespula maculifrons]|uniref:Uncharacterized protein n=1 Tax=Vespula maculifrons TaxID=7453 RepID=A0ABD2BUD1_VESMC